jgi:hypothetical protein
MVEKPKKVWETKQGKLISWEYYPKDSNAETARKISCTILRKGDEKPVFVGFWDKADWGDIIVCNQNYVAYKENLAGLYLNGTSISIIRDPRTEQEKMIATPAPAPALKKAFPQPVEDVSDILAMDEWMPGWLESEFKKRWLNTPPGPVKGQIMNVYMDARMENKLDDIKLQNAEIIDVLRAILATLKEAKK